MAFKRAVESRKRCIKLFSGSLRSSAVAKVKPGMGVLAMQGV
jgi:hypothetical protein